MPPAIKLFLPLANFSIIVKVNFERSQQNPNWTVLSAHTQEMNAISQRRWRNVIVEEDKTTRSIVNLPWRTTFLKYWLCGLLLQLNLARHWKCVRVNQGVVTSPWCKSTHLCEKNTRVANQTNRLTTVLQDVPLGQQIYSVVSSWKATRVSAVVDLPTGRSKQYNLHSRLALSNQQLPADSARPNARYGVVDLGYRVTAKSQPFTKVQ